MNIAITLDYELFSGTNCGTVQKCLIDPMDSFLYVLDKYNIKATIFVDAAFLYVLNNHKKENTHLESEWQLISSQLKILHERGHDIQLHIHPQWFYSTYSNNQWIIDTCHFKLSDIPVKDFDMYISNSKKILESIINKKTVIFRAGGYSIQTLKRYDTFLKKYGIKADSSVFDGDKYFSDNQWYDYSKTPPKSHYRFDRNLIEEINNGPLLEFKISTYKRNKLLFLWDKYYSKKILRNSIKRFSDGQALISANMSKVKRALNYMFKPNIVQASFDDMSGYFIENVYVKNRKLEDFIIISHPKLLTPYSIECAESFIHKHIKEDKFVTLYQLLCKYANT